MSQSNLSRYLDIIDKMKGQKLAVETSDYMICLMLELANQLQAEQQAHNALKDKLKKMEKYAEFGRLALEITETAETEVCMSGIKIDSGCGYCIWKPFCQKRDELLEREVKVDE